MNTLLYYLEMNKGQVVSGQALSENMKIPRAAIWKAAQELRAQDYPLISHPGVGYALAEDCDILSEEGVRARLPERYAHLPVRAYPLIDSTNAEMKRLSPQPPFLIAADAQTMGRGRLGRSFFSPDGGLYMTLMADVSALSDPTAVTTAAAVAVSRAARKVAGVETEIKWVNDVFYRGRKVCGILTEALNDSNTGKLESALIGVGVNTGRADFPDELMKTAGSLELPSGLRCALAAEIVSSLLDILAGEAYLDEYRARSIALGRRVTVLRGNSARKALALDIDGAGGLIVRYDDGNTETLRGGEISLRVPE